jgi:hypothetical protein
VTPPEGTYLAPLSKGAIRFPPPLRRYCESQGWDLFRFVLVDHDHVRIEPVIGDAAGEFHASFTPDGLLWIPSDLRETVALSEQSVMLRLENGAISVYIRKVFETLGFRPR